MFGYDHRVFNARIELPSNMFFHAAEQDKKQNNNLSFYRPIVIYCADGVTPR